MPQKKGNVPLEEALAVVGSGWYTRWIWFASGMVNFAGFVSVQAMSIVVTAAGCDLNIDSYQKGILSSMSYVGSIFSSHLGGALADIFGRRRVIIVCCFITGVVTAISSLSPSVEALSVAFFINGFLISGIFTPGYVYASEFCPAAKRATALIVVSSFGSLSNAFLPGLAWLILPIDIHYSLPFGVEFSSWRLFLALLSLPLFVGAAVFMYLPETPKFLLNEGLHDETMDILTAIYAVNSRKMKEDFPINRVCLDGMDQEAEKAVCHKRSCMYYLRTIVQQTALLFQRRFLMYTLLSCAVVCLNGGIYNTMILWAPEQARQIFLFSNSNSYYNVTICDVMGNRLETIGVIQCELNYEAYIPGIVIGLLQFVTLYVVNFMVLITGVKPLTVAFSTVSAAGSIMLIFCNEFYTTVLCLVFLVVIQYPMFFLALSVVVSYFPTTLRSNATSIVMLSSRFSTVLFTQVLGAAFESYCEIAYGGFSACIVGLVILFIIMPVKK